MSLSAREQRTLSRIADQIAVSDPEFAGSLAVFNQLARGEEMPKAPQRQADRRRRSRGSARKRRASGPAWHLLTVWILIIAVLITVALVLSQVGHKAGERSHCTQLWSGACVPR